MNIKNDKTQEFELRATNLLSQEHFIMLMKFFKIQPLNTVAYVKNYFVDSSRQLMFFAPTGTTLCVTTKKSKTTVELKIPQSNGENLEFKDVLDEEQYSNLFTHGILCDGQVKFALANIKVHEPFSLLGFAKTLQSEAIHNAWEVGIFLEDTFLPQGKRDYRIKVETDDLAYSQETLQKIMAEFDIPMIVPPPKIESFYEAIGI